jgi:hypothetical protein
MAAPRQFTNSEVAERLRILAQVSSEPDKRLFFHLARMCDVETELVDGSRRKIVESRSLLAELEKQVP